MIENFMNLDDLSPNKLYQYIGVGGSINHNSYKEASKDK